MSVSRRSFIKVAVATSGATLIPMTQAAFASNLSVSEAIRRLSEQVFVAPADQASRASLQEWPRFAGFHGR